MAIKVTLNLSGNSAGAVTAVEQLMAGLKAAGVMSDQLNVKFNANSNQIDKIADAAKRLKSTAQGLNLTNTNISGTISPAPAEVQSSKPIFDLGSAFTFLGNSALGASRGLNTANLIFRHITDAGRLLSQGLMTLGRQMTYFVTIPLVAMLVSGFRAAVDFEDAMVRVQKTTGLFGEKLAIVEAGLRDLSRRSISSQTELAKMAEQIGQLGIQNPESIVSLLRLFERLVTATDITAENIAVDMGRIASAFGMDLNTAEGVQQLAAFANVLNSLENQTKASAGELVTGTLAAAPVAAIFSTTAAEAAGLISYLVGVGYSAEEAGTGLRNLYMKMVQNADVLQAILGSTEKYNTVQKVATALNENATTVVIDLVRAISQGESSTQKLTAAFELADIRGGKALASMANNSEEFLKIMGLVEDQLKNQTSLETEYQLALLSTSSQLKVARNNLYDLAITVGKTLLPVVNQILQMAIPAIQAFTSWFEKLPPQMQLAGVALVMFAALLGPLLTLLSGFTFGLSMVGLAFNRLFYIVTSGLTIFGKLLKGLASLGASARLLGVGLTGGLTIAFVVLLANLRQNGDKIQKFFLDLAARAQAWGQRLIETYGYGMMAGAAQVLSQVLTAIGNFIGRFIMAKSPPEIGPLSHIDQWGKTLFDTYLQSFLNADFSVLSTVGNLIGRVLRNLEFVGKLPENAQFGFLNEARTSLAQLIQVFEDTGQISESVLSEVVKNLGEAKDEIAELIRRQLIYNGLKRQLAELEKQRKQVENTYKTEIELQAQSNLSAEERAELIRRATRERDRSLKSIEEEKAVLEEQAAAAEEASDWQHELVQAMLDQDQIQVDLADALARLSKAVSDLSSALGGINMPSLDDLDSGAFNFGPIEDPFDTMFDTLDERINQGKANWDAFLRGLKGEPIVDDGWASQFVDSTMIGLYQFGLKIHNVWSGITGLFEGAKNALTGIDTGPAMDFIEQLTSTEGWETVRAIWSAALDSLAQIPDMIQPIFDEIEKLDQLPIDIGQVFGTIITVVAGAVGVIVGLISAIVQGVLTGAKYIQGFVGLIQQGVAHAIQGLIQALGGLFTLIFGLLTFNGEKIKKGFFDLFAGVVGILSGLASAIIGLVGAPLSFVVGLVEGFVRGVIGFFTKLYDTLVGHSIIPDLMSKMIAIIGGGVATLLGQWNTFWTGVRNAFLNAKAALVNIVEGLVQKLFNLGSGMLTAMLNGINQSKNDLVNGFSSFIGQMVQAAGPLLSAINKIMSFLGMGDIKLPNVSGGTINVGTNNGVKTQTAGYTGSGGSGAVPGGYGYTVDYRYNQNGTYTQTVRDPQGNVISQKVVKADPATGKPQLASGGVTTGPTDAVIGEGGEREAVIPLSKLPDIFTQIYGPQNTGGGGNTVNINNPVVRNDTDIEKIADAVSRVLSRQADRRARMGGVA